MGAPMLIVDLLKLDMAQGYPLPLSTALTLAFAHE
jgi:hypothetical protein